MKFLPTNKNFLDEDDEEVKIVEALCRYCKDGDEPFDEKSFNVFDSIFTVFIREGRLSKFQYNRLVEIFNQYCDYDEDV